MTPAHTRHKREEAKQRNEGRWKPFTNCPLETRCEVFQHGKRHKGVHKTDQSQTTGPQNSSAKRHKWKYKTPTSWYKTRNYQCHSMTRKKGKEGSHFTSLHTCIKISVSSLIACPRISFKLIFESSRLVCPLAEAADAAGACCC